MSKDKSEKKAPVKKGTVINRAANRTVDTSVARCDPKWEDTGGGVLVQKGMGGLHTPRSNPIRMEGSKFRSVSYNDTKKAPTPAAPDSSTLLSAVSE